MIKLFPPVKTVSIWGGSVKVTSLDTIKIAIRRSGQSFYQNLGRACDFIKDAPCDQTIYEYFGKKGHGALDIPCPDGTPILASHDGVVLEINNDVATGLGVVLWDERQYKTVYWHFKANKVKTGDRVKAGDVLGLGDNTGYSSGSHLHFAFKETNNKGNTINKDNEYRGAIDPLPYLVWFDEVMNEKFIKLYYLAAFNRLPDSDEVAFWLDKPHVEIVKATVRERAKFLEYEYNTISQ